MRSTKSVFGIILLSLSLSACSINNKAIDSKNREVFDVFNQNVYDFNQLKFKKLTYNSFKNESPLVVGTTIMEFRKNNENQIITIQKKYSPEFLTGIKDTVVNSRIYTIDPSFSLVNFEETETIGKDDRLNFEQKVNYEYAYSEINTIIIGKEKTDSSINLPPNQRIFTKEMGFLSLMFLKELSSKKYIFYLDAEGYIQNYKLEKKETINIKELGNRTAYKLISTTPSETYIWIDTENNVLLKKEEHLSGGNTLTTILNKYE